MLATNNQQFRLNRKPNTNQRGGAAVEFALLVLVFLGLVFGVLEMARVLYMFNILQEVTRRAGVIAANSNFNEGALISIRNQALFSDRNGTLIFGAPITPSHIKIDYLSIDRDNSTGTVTPQPIASMPSSPAENYANCVANPYGPSCIRLVRVRICQPDSDGDDCTAVPYEMQFPLIDFTGLTLPRSETIVPSNTLGHRFDSAAGS